MHFSVNFASPNLASVPENASILEMFVCCAFKGKTQCEIALQNGTVKSHSKIALKNCTTKLHSKIAMQKCIVKSQCKITL
jgi:hypothetical protein